MAPSSRNCRLQLAWRYVALVGVVCSIVPATVPLSFGSTQVQVDAMFLSLISCGWWFLALFWNIFVIAWESSRKELMHPGAVVGLDLCIFLYGLAAIAWGVWQTIDINFQYGWNFQWGKEWMMSLEDRDNALACFIIFSVIVALTTLIHFILFVVGCRNEHYRLKTIKAAAKQLAQKNAAAAGTDLADPEDLKAAG